METNNEQTFRADYKAEYLFKKRCCLENNSNFRHVIRQGFLKLLGKKNLISQLNPIFDI